MKNQSRDQFAYNGTKDKRRLDEYKQAMFKIREATGVSEINVMIQKFATQGETLENLQDLKQTNEKKLLALIERKQNVKDDLEKMKLEGLEALTSKQVDDMEKNLQNAEVRHAKVQEGHDMVRK